MRARETQPGKTLFYVGFATVGIIVCLIMGAVALDQYCKRIFRDLPYRKYFGFYLDTVVLRGWILSPIANALFTKRENLSTTDLPIWEIQLTERKLAALSRDLPASGRIYQSGTTVINSSPFPARFRLRGDGFWHWKSKQKSWKIKLRGGQVFEGQNEFNLVNPRSTTTLIWPLTSYVAKSMELKTPSLQHVHARLNGNYLGALYLVENFDHGFIARSGLPGGALYEDEALGPFSHQSWEEIDTWYIRGPDSQAKHQAGKDPEDKYEKLLSELLRCITSEDDEEFHRRFEELVDIEQYLRWWAHTIIVYDIHQDRKHNNRLYLNPTSGKFQQIPWDMSIQFKKDPREYMDLNLNPITERLLRSPEHVYARNKIIWEAVRGPCSSDKQIQWLENTANVIREDIYCDPYKDAQFFIIPPLTSIRLRKPVLSMCLLPISNGIFEKDLRELKVFLRERMSYIEESLSETDADLTFYAPVSEAKALPNDYTPVGALGLRVGGHVGLRIKEVRVRFDSSLPQGNAPVLFYGNGGSPAHGQKVSAKNILSENGQAYAFEVDELLLPGRSRKPPFGPTSVRYPFTVALTKPGNSPPRPLSAEAVGVHPLTHREITFKASLTGVEAEILSTPIGRFQLPLSPPKRVVWDGSKMIDKDFLVGKDETLVIRPGTRIAFEEGTSLLSHGKVLARGTPTQPITFTRTPRSPSWGVVALQGHDADGSVFEYCTFEYAGEDEMGRVLYTGALSIYNADATVKNCTFRFNQGDDALNTKFSSTNVVQCTFTGNSADAYDLDFSTGLVARNVFDGNGNDGIDCGGAHPTIKDNRILHCGDKGISIGERSKPLVDGNLIAYCTIGIAVKDQSNPEIKNNEFVSNAVAVSAYQKKKVFGGAHCTIQDSIFRNNARVSEHDALSSISFEGCTFEDVAAGRHE